MAKQIDYDDNLENLLKDEAEKAESLSILHRLSHEKYSLYSNAINIPVIVGSSAVGFMTGIQIDFEDINIILGIFSVVIGCIKALDSYFQLAQRSERHRLVSLQYSQINRKIAVELSLEREVRMDAKDALNVIRTDVKNLEELAPIIPDDIIDKYKVKYPKVEGENIKRPALTNGLTEVVINKPDYALRNTVGDSNHIVRADLVIRSRRQSHDADSAPRNIVDEIVDIPLGDIKDGVFSA
jgi:hypothetical protein